MCEVGHTPSPDDDPLFFAALQLQFSSTSTGSAASTSIYGGPRKDSSSSANMSTASAFSSLSLRENSGSLPSLLRVARGAISRSASRDDKRREEESGVTRPSVTFGLKLEGGEEAGRVKLLLSIEVSEAILR